VIGLFILVLVRIWRIAHLSKDMLGTYICAGVFTMILWQVFQNVAMTVGFDARHRLAAAVHLLRGSGLVTFFAMFGLGAERPHAPLPLTHCRR
jgi:rod shape determining protein RodA